MSPKNTPGRDSAGMLVPLDAAADALLRTAVEAARQHERVAKLNERGAHFTEMQEAGELGALCLRHLGERLSLYEVSASGGRGAHDEAFWHSANSLWHAAREYSRRHSDSNASSIQLAKHSPDKLGELTLEYELEASALLALKNAISSYKKLRPESP